MPKAKSKTRKPQAVARMPVRLYGVHAVAAALANVARRPIRLYASQSGLEKLPVAPTCPVHVSPPETLSKLVDGASHQGLVLETHPVPDQSLEPLLATAQRLVMLDQVTDPHNVGAIFRSARAFGADGIIMQDRHCPPETGALAKAASGALETLPWVRVTNLSRALEAAVEAGFWCIGLAAEAEVSLSQLSSPEKVLLVLGAEGRGLRHNVAKHCDQLVHIPIAADVESLNVSNAAAVALYALTSH